MNFIIKKEITIETINGFKIPPRTMDLLKKIDQTGSLNTAVKKLGIPYSTAWNAIHKINCNACTPIVITQRGGKGGGIATLTPSGKELLIQYDEAVNF